MASPPKPWEQAGAATTGLGPMPMNNTSTSAAQPAPPTTAPPSAASPGAPPELPERPSSLASAVNQNAAAYSRMGTNPYGTYGTGYSSPYASPYSRMGGGYGGYGGAMGGGMYGGGIYGGGYGGMYGGGMYGGGMGGMPGNPGDPNSLTNSFNQSTAATFQMLEGIVGAFGGFAQMLESTYMATHSSFYAMISVAEQFGNLRDTLGSILGIFAIMRWVRTLIAKITGRPPPADATSLTPAAFARFTGASPPAGAPGSAPPKASRKPLLFFVVAAFGLPYLMSKLIRTLAASQQEKMAADGGGQLERIDPSQLEYCRVLYDYTPQSQPGGAGGVDLEVKKGDFVAVLSKTDPFGAPSEWWRCRTRDARMGYLPSTYLEVIRRHADQQQQVQQGKPVAAIKAADASESSRTNSLTSSGETTSSIQSPPTPVSVGRPMVGGGKGVAPLTVDDFQKSQFYS